MAQTLQLGHMHPHMLAAYHDSMHEYQAHAGMAQVSAAKAMHPSAGNRSAEFAEAARIHSDIAVAHAGIMKEAVSTVAPAEKLATRRSIFDQARHASQAAYN